MPQSPKTIDEVSAETLRKVSGYRYDWILEKHEGPWTWEHDIEDRTVDLLPVEGFSVLLPIEKQHHPNISILRCIVSEDRESLTIFLKDTTYDKGRSAGRVAVCDRIPGEEWYITILYHEWMIIDHKTKDTVLDD